MRRHSIAIAGLGLVGGGIAEMLAETSEAIARRTGVEIVVAKAAERDPSRAARSGIPAERLVSEAAELLGDKSVQTVVELMGGTGYAREFVLAAIRDGKNIVTANKALLASFGSEIFAAAKEKGVSIGFEAAVGGGIPIIRTLREAYVGDSIERIVGILNGTCNYILTRMTRDGASFGDALADAKAQGYAEADPTLDVSGLDSAHKIAILARLAFGGDFTLDKVYTEGIQDLETIDITFAGEFGYRVKLLAIAKKTDGAVELRVHPCLVSKSHPLAHIEEVFNSIFVRGRFVGDTMLYGQGAGRRPSASAVVADLIDVATGRAATTGFGEAVASVRAKPMEETVARYYIRFQAIDKPGVLAAISGVLGRENISIAQVIQKGRREGQSVPIVVLTHEAKEGSVQKALLQISKLDVVTGRTVLLREEE